MNKISLRAALYGGVAAALLALLTPTADASTPRPSGDCAKVRPADYRLCAKVRAQHAYGWTNSHGTPMNWVPNGRALVKEITGQGLTGAEMHDYLTGAASSYRAWVTHVTFNVDAIVKRCGHKHGSAGVALVTEHGQSYTYKWIVCD